MPAKIKLQIIVVIFLLLFTAKAWAEPEVQSTAAILINSRTGEVLWEKSAHQQMYPASITKILTTTLLLENAEPSEVAVPSILAEKTRGSSLYLRRGQKITVENLLYALMLQSANDGSVVAAEHVAGTVEAFATMMNMKAQEVGALNSNFTNPHGLPDDNHLTTAYDMAMIARYAMRDERFRALATTSRHTIAWPDSETQYLRNRIPLFSTYDGMLGVKTGYTASAGRTFVGAAERDGLELITVVLQASSGDQIWEDTIALLDYGFTNFTSVQPVKQGDILETAAVRYGDAVNLLAADSFELTRPIGVADVSVEIMVEPVTAPVSKGTPLGEAVILAAGEPVGTVPLLAADHAQRAALTTVRFWVLSSLGAILILRLRKSVRRYQRKKSRFRRRYSDI